MLGLLIMQGRVQKLSSQMESLEVGTGTLKLSRLAKELAGDVNIKRKTKGLLPRPLTVSGCILFTSSCWNSRLSKCWQIISDKPVAQTSNVSCCPKTRCYKRAQVIEFFKAAIRLTQMVELVECFVQKIALRLFNGDTNQAAFRILSDFRKGKFRWVALERSPR